MSQRRPARVVNSVAPIRVCDNGGWTDTWFARRGAIFNIGVYPYAEVQVQVFQDGPPEVILHAENYDERYTVPAKASSSSWGAPPAPRGCDRLHERSRGPAARGDHPLRGAHRGRHRHVGRRYRGPGGSARCPDPGAAHAPRGRLRGPAGRDRDAAPPVRHSGPAGLRLRRDQLHRDVQLSAGHRHPDPASRRAVVGAGAAARPRLPWSLPRLLRHPRAGHPRARRRRARLPAPRRPPTDRAPLPRRPPGRRLCRPGTSDDREQRGPRLACTPLSSAPRPPR